MGEKLKSSNLGIHTRLMCFLCEQSHHIWLSPFTVWKEREDEGTAALSSLKINKHIFTFVGPFVLDGKQVKSEECVCVCES